VKYPGLLYGRDTTKCMQYHPVGERRALVRKDPVRDVTAVGWVHEQVVAAITSIWFGDAHVGDVTEPEVIDHAQRLRRCLDYGRPTL
jgi:hypothetical protein